MDKRFKKVEYWKINYGDLEDIICKEFGLDEYSITATEEYSNDESHAFDLDGNMEEWEDEEDNRTLQKFLDYKHGLYKPTDSYERQGVMMYTTRMLLNELVRRGIIDKGNYLVNVSW